jgi:hypothetical protein
MNFPRFWRALKTGKVTTWGWSDTSDDDALSKAKERQRRVFAWLDGGCKTEWLWPYGYPDRPMREEMLREFAGTNGEPAGVLTRNSYGCVVLNTAAMVFVDVDTGNGSVGGFISRLFGRKTLSPQKALEESLRAKLEAWIAARPDWRWRMYRTCAGVRLMAVHQPVPPDDPLVLDAFEQFGGDRLYRALCKNQRCFRARLTPKPWRCDVSKPPWNWPWPNAEAEAHFREWEREYVGKTAAYATCRLLDEFGSAPPAPEFEGMIQTHDRSTRVNEDLPLA